MLGFRLPLAPSGAYWCLLVQAGCAGLFQSSQQPNTGTGSAVVSCISLRSTCLLDEPGPNSCTLRSKERLHSPA